MKKIILLLPIVFLLTCFKAYAGNRDWRLLLTNGYSYNIFSYNAGYSYGLGLERELSNRSTFDIMILSYSNFSNFPKINKETDINLYSHYNFNIYNGRNSISFFRLGGTIGKGKSGFQGGLNIGFEYNISISPILRLGTGLNNSTIFNSRDINFTQVYFTIKIKI